MAIPAFAGITSDMGNYIGYTIAGSKTIIGWHDDNGKRGDSFEGCDFGRIIIFDDNTTLTCQEYGYQYSYRPTATILYNGSSIKMIVEDESYSMSR